jgi:hypothetical protein
VLVILRAAERWAPGDTITDVTPILRREGRMLVELSSAWPTWTASVSSAAPLHGIHSNRGQFFGDYVELGACHPRARVALSNYRLVRDGFTPWAESQSASGLMRSG